VAPSLRRGCCPGLRVPAEVVSNPWRQHACGQPLAPARTARALPRDVRAAQSSEAGRFGGSGVCDVRRHVRVGGDASTQAAAERVNQSIVRSSPSLLPTRRCRPSRSRTSRVPGRRRVGSAAGRSTRRMREGAGEVDDPAGQAEHRDLLAAADVHGSGLVRGRQGEDAVDRVGEADDQQSCLCEAELNKRGESPVPGDEAPDTPAERASDQRQDCLCRLREHQRTAPGHSLPTVESPGQPCPAWQSARSTACASRNRSGTGRPHVSTKADRRSERLRSRLQNRHALHMVRHRKDVGFSGIRKVAGPSPFCGPLYRLRAPGASNERHDQQPIPSSAETGQAAPTRSRRFSRTARPTWTRDASAPAPDASGRRALPLQLAHATEEIRLCPAMHAALFGLAAAPAPG